MSQRGFTLLELLVVLGIIALIAAVAAPSISSGLASANLKTAAGHLAATLRYARTEAISMKAVCAVNLFLEEGSYSVSAGGDKLDGKLPQGVSFAGVQHSEERTEGGVGQFFFTQRAMPAPGR